jgi:type I site-specific restriction endonuclease
MGSGKVICSTTERVRQLRRKLGAIESESGDVELQCNNIKKSALDTAGDLVGKVDRKTKMPMNPQEMISNTDGPRKWKNINNEEVRNYYRRLRNEFKRSTSRPKGIP